VLSPRAGGHRNHNIATLATEKKCYALFFLRGFARIIPKEATYVITGGNCECGNMIKDQLFRLFNLFYTHSFLYCWSSSK
jgi:hypothetical protein